MVTVYKGIPAFFSTTKEVEPILLFFTAIILTTYINFFTAQNRKKFDFKSNFYMKYIIQIRLRVLSHSYFSPYFGLISVSFLSFCFVFLCILCVLSPFGTVLVSKFGINFLKNRRRKISLFFFSK